LNLRRPFFASEKYVEAREEFYQSVKKNFKRAVSLYYVGYISKELRDYKKAFTYLRAIQRLSDSEAQEVKQSAELLIADIYLDQVEKHEDPFSAIEDHVIPQYKRALEVDQKSKLAPKIKQKIYDLLRRYDLVLFKLRNGRPTAYPPYFLKLGAEFGYDSNVTFSPNDTTVSKAKQSSMYGKISSFGKYSFYYDDFFSISPELAINSTRYFNREPLIYRNDSLIFSPAIRTAYEHTLNKYPSSFLLDYEFSEIKRDIQASNRLDFNSKTNSIGVGERINLSSNSETTFRLKYKDIDSYLNNTDGKIYSFSYEQIQSFTDSNLFWFIGFDQMRLTDDSFDTNAWTLRLDYLAPRFTDLFNTSIGFLGTQTDPINQRPTRGIEYLLAPNLRVLKSFTPSFQLGFKAEYQENFSKDHENFSYRKMLYSFDVDYIF
jgi:hypothetical protein